MSVRTSPYQHLASLSEAQLAVRPPQSLGQGTDPPESANHTRVEQCFMVSPHKKNYINTNAYDVKDVVLALPCRTVPTSAKVKDEPSNTDPPEPENRTRVEQSFMVSPHPHEKNSISTNPCDNKDVVLALQCHTVPAFAKVKDEPSDCNDLCNPDHIGSINTSPCDVKDAVPALPLYTVSTFAKVKDEPSYCNDLCSPDNIGSINTSPCDVRDVVLALPCHTVPTFAKVMDEPSDCNDLCNPDNIGSINTNPRDVKDVVLALPCHTVPTSAVVKDEPSDCNDLCNPDNIGSSKPVNCLEVHESEQKFLTKAIAMKPREVQYVSLSVPCTLLGSASSTCLHVKDESLDNNYIRRFDKDAVGFSKFSSLRSELQLHDEAFKDPVDHMSLQDRIKLLVSGVAFSTSISGNFQCFTETGPSLLRNKLVFSEPVKPISTRCPREREMATDSVITVREEDCPGLLQGNSGLSCSKVMENNAATSSGESHFVKVDLAQGTDPAEPVSCRGIKKSFMISPHEKNSSDANPCAAMDVVLALPCFTVPTFVEVKDEPSDCNDFHNSGNILGVHESDQGSDFSTYLQVKAESLYENYINRSDKDAVGCSFNSLSLRNDLQHHDEAVKDLVDHMPLLDRIWSLVSGDAFKTDTSNNFECFAETLRKETFFSEPVKCSTTRRPSKRKKTATDSVEDALEEDAPGLLRALVDKGVSVDEIKLYGDIEDDDPLDMVDCFSELGAVISKIFSQRPSLLKFAPLHHPKCSKDEYCLACLVSLVEQTRYLRFRKWPIEWGWCRDLQSFIFVFERHHRIVLERPEYGFATYFFELADSQSIEWQIKRLVTAMKLANCSRVTLIENKALLVGEDLSELEARVLTGYGWTPNSGLATMLNYCDRVVHDRRKKDGAEWRLKIGKLLMDGFNGGSLVSTATEKMETEHDNAGQSPEIKLEH